MQPNKPDRPNRPNEQAWLEEFFSIMLVRAAHSLLIVGLQYDCAGWLDNHQQALIQGVGAREICVASGGTMFGLELTVA
jgi:hypothetical protein